MVRIVLLAILVLLPVEVAAQQVAPISPPKNPKIIESSPSKSLLLFFAAVTQHDYDSARKFLPRDIVKMVETKVDGGFETFINEVDKENAGNKLVINSEKIEQGKAEVETLTITTAGKRIIERWSLRLEDDLWKLDIFQPR